MIKLKLYRQLKMFVKRLFDILIAFLGLILLAPVFIIIAIFIKFTSNGAIFFKQERIGLNGKVFKIYKFRTMVKGADAIGLKITVANDNRITRVGKFLRETKLDELPQLINVLIGEMSLVGPRPEVAQYVASYSEQIKQKVLSVKPGITDWASIMMLNESELLAKELNPHKAYLEKILPIKLELAIKYVDTRSFRQDMKILWTTFTKLFKGNE